MSANIIAALNALKKGESIVYHVGPTLLRSGNAAQCARDLYNKGRVTLFIRRLDPPTNSSGTVDLKNGRGTFEFVAKAIK